MKHYKDPYIQTKIEENKFVKLRDSTVVEVEPLSCGATLQKKDLFKSPKWGWIKCPEELVGEMMTDEYLRWFKWVRPIK